VSASTDRGLEFVHDQLPGRIVFGAGRRHQAPAEIGALDPAGVLLIGGSHEVGTIDELGAAVDVPFDTIVGVRPHVPADAVRDALATADRFGPDVVVTVGGGSATGLGKAVALARDVALVALPTTYSGSEMTPIWGTTHDGAKRTGRSLRVLPTTVVYDPELTVGLPRQVTVDSAFNAIAHCAEALWLPHTSPITTEAAISAIRSIVAGVVDVVSEPSSVEARATLLYGAHRAGSVVAVAGTGLLHETAHVLGGMFALDHGAMYAALTPHVVRHQASTDALAGRRLAEALGADPGDTLAELADRLGASRSLAELGLPRDRLGEAVAAVSHDTGATAADIEALLSAAM
jgi:maleylacetate reductase